MDRFENKVAVVTGASQLNGVGGATAALLVKEGAKVIMLDKDAENGFALSKELGEYALFFTCDITSEKNVKTVIAQGIDAFGELDILVNNAAVLSYTPVHQTSLEEWNRVMGVNVTGQFLCAKYAIQSMELQLNLVQFHQAALFDLYLN